VNSINFSKQIKLIQNIFLNIQEKSSGKSFGGLKAVSSGGCSKINQSTSQQFGNETTLNTPAAAAASLAAQMPYPMNMMYGMPGMLLIDFYILSFL